MVLTDYLTGSKSPTRLVEKSNWIKVSFARDEREEALRKFELFEREVENVRFEEEKSHPSSLVHSFVGSPFGELYARRGLSL